MELFAIAVTIFSGILTYQAWKNGRWMKQAHEDTQNLLKKMHEDTQNLLKELKEMHKDTQNLIKGMHEDTSETLREIARLIVAEVERTREAIK